ncbi:MAG TPA: S46 family peptidase, partial [Terriglobales bacterium]|nr:S46 family peptidase [Terriglobales bacterium]
MTGYLLRFFLFISLSAAGVADEGNWLFNAPPLAQIKAKYGFALTPEWLDHIRLAAVRFDNGGSGAFVSSDGLTITNHHLAQDCLQGLSHSSQDFFRPAFYASRPKDELRCPSLELNVVEQISDVTDKINAAVHPGMDDATAANARKAA